MDTGLERISESSAGIERHLSLAAASGERLDASLARLQASRATTERPHVCDRRRARDGRPRDGLRSAQVRVAAVDLGTNSTRLLVADVNGHAQDEVEEIVRRLTITRLGEGVDERRRLLPVAIARVRNVLSGYRRELEALGAERTLCFGTSAVRDAENGEAFLGEIEWSYGFTTRLLSGDEEAQLTLRGIGAVEPGTLVVDIGGGSTELQLAGTDFGEPRRRLRADDRALRRGRRRRPCARARAPPGGAAGAGDRRGGNGDDDRRARPGPRRSTTRSASTGTRISAAAAAEQVARLASLPLDERQALPGLEPGRAPVIVAGGAILTEILAFYGLDAIVASERDILHGAALAAAELPAPEEGAAPPGAYTCC